jgi:hypothetical protein
MSPTTPITPDNNSTNGTSQPPASAPTIDTDVRGTITVRDNFFIAFAAPDATREPTEAEYAQMVNLTETFFNSVLSAMFANDPARMFVRVDMNLADTMFQASIPAERFNIYMEFDSAALVFTPDSTPPTAEEAFALLRDSISQDYIVQYVRSAMDTPFVSTNEVVFRASEMQNPNPSNSTRNGDNLQSREGDGEDAPLPIATLAVASAASFFVLAAGLLAYRRRRASRRPRYEGITYEPDTHKAHLDGYFTERSVTDVSESQSRFPTLPMVREEETQPIHVRV